MTLPLEHELLELGIADSARDDLPVPDETLGTAFDAVNAPPQRNGTFSLRASCPMMKFDITGSGIPKVGAPDFKLMEERKLPRMNGAPGRTSCVNAQHIIASASA